MGAHGWPFASIDSFPAADADPLYGSEHVKDLYLKADPNYGGRLVIDQLRRLLSYPSIQSFPPQVHCSRAVGQEECDDREQRELRDSSHLQHCVQPFAAG